MQKFFLYARKSTDVEDKQVLSIEAQLTELREYAKRENIIISTEVVEKQSAKYIGRPLFNKMLDEIEKFGGNILAWNPDRLARNSVDGGRIIYLLDTGKLASLKFPTFGIAALEDGNIELAAKAIGSVSKVSSIRGGLLEKYNQALNNLSEEKKGKFLTSLDEVSNKQRDFKKEYEKKWGQKGS